MKILFYFLFVILVFVISSNPCEEIINHDECISKEGCCYVENSFRSYINRQCIFIETEEKAKKFCSLFNSMNKEEGFTSVLCETKNYKYE